MVDEWLGSDPANEAQVAALQKDVDAKVEALLTAEQKAAWKAHEEALALFYDRQFAKAACGSAAAWGPGPRPS